MATAKKAKNLKNQKNLKESKTSLNSGSKKKAAGLAKTASAKKAPAKQAPAKKATSANASKPVVLIMAGGKGERFWPRSTVSTPKQLQKIYSNKTLLQETIDRARAFTSADRIFIGCNPSLKKAIQKGHKIPDAQFVLEPEGRNTAPIIALAALQLESRFPGTVQVILSADHFIQPLDRFAESMKAGMTLAQQDYLVTCGIVPTRPDPGYGYIQPRKSEVLKPAGWTIEQFHEKPDIEKAAGYVKDGFLWNSGIFLWKGSVILEEFRKHAPEILQPLEKTYKSAAALKKVFPTLPEQPIDIAIMERSQRRAVVPASFQWDDVGSWLALERIRSESADADGNIFAGEKTQTAAFDARGNIIVPNSKRLIALLGVKDLVYVETDTSVLIATKERLNDIKKLIAKLKEKPALQSFLQ